MNHFIKILTLALFGLINPSASAELGMPAGKVQLKIWPKTETGSAINTQKNISKSIGFGALPCVPSGCGAEYHVAKTGADINDGSGQKPFFSIFPSF